MTPREAVRRRAIFVLCGISILLVTAHFNTYTYFAIIITEITGQASAVVVFLTLFGIAAGSAIGSPILAHSFAWLPPVSATLALIVLVLVIVRRPTSNVV